jgi:hypothetical protein
MGSARRKITQAAIFIIFAQELFDFPLMPLTAYYVESG